MKTSGRCPKCDGRMADGIVLTQDSNHAVHVSKWQPGAPVKSFWMGIKQVKAEQKAIATFRCERCGYLESYAA